MAGGLFGGGKVSKQAPEFASLMVQTSMWGRPIPIAYGQTRLAGNLVWYGDFTAIPHTQSTGGKGGGGGGGQVTDYTYNAAVVLSLCEGPILDVTKVWAGKVQTTPAALNLTKFLGSIGQATWSYLSTYHQGEAIGYSHIGYLASGAYDLGAAASLPNHNFEITGALASTTGVSSVPDAALDRVMTDILTNDYYGAGFPVSKLGNTGPMANYCRAHGIWVSPLYVEPETAASIVTRLAEIGNTALVFSEAQLKFIPYGDAVVTANGVTFTPNTTVIYSLTDNDFIHSGGGNPVTIKRSTPADAYNTVRVTFRDREQDYTSAPQEAKETDAIQKYGLRIAPAIDYKEICDADSARVVAQLILQRSLYQRNTYSFTIGLKYCLLEPMDLVSLTELTGTGLVGQIVQITSIEETEDGRLNIEAQDWLGTVHSAPLFQYQGKGGYTLNLDAPPGPVGDPLIFDAPSQLATTGYEVWIAAAGLNQFWGGCSVWVSTDGVSYKKLGETKARARFGTLTSTLVAALDPDTTDSFSVDLSPSLGALQSAGSQASTDGFNTLCYVDGEMLAFQVATLNSPNNYTLGTYLRRGVYGTPSTPHLIGSNFARIDSALFRYAYDPALIGTTLYFKLTSKNIWGGAEESLADVLQYTYTIAGPLGSPGTPTNMTATVGTSNVVLDWTAVGTPNLFHYEVRQGGTTWETAAFVARSLTTQLKVPPQPVGLQTWWVKAIDRGGAYSIGAASCSLPVVAPSAPTVTALVVDNNLQLNWTASKSTQPILTYEVRKGAVFATSTVVGSKNGLFTTIIENLGGTNTYWVVGIDIGGNFGTPTPFVATISSPPDYLLVLDASWPNVLSATDRAPGITGTTTVGSTLASTWGSARTEIGYSTGKWYWEIHIDSINAGANIMLGIGQSLAANGVANYVGIDVNGYGYYSLNGNSYHTATPTALGATYTAGDLIGILLDADADTVQFYKNGAAQGSPLAITVGKTWFPMVSLFDAACQIRLNLGDSNFVYPPAATVNGLASNAALDQGTVVMPVDVTTTYQAHFTSPAWASPNDQVIAGFEAFAEKSLASGYFEQVFDCGQTLVGAKVTVTPSIAAGDGTPGYTTDIAVSNDGSTYTNNVGVNTLFANGFRYVKVRVNATSSGNDDLAVMSALNILVEVKIKSDQGSVSCLSTDVGGTVVPFNYPYLAINSINLTPDGSTAIIPVVSFAGGSNPTSFKALLFNTSGARISGTARWIARGY